MGKTKFATLAVAENAFETLKKLVVAKPELEAQLGKKLGDVVDLLKPRSDVSKLLGQAYNIGEGKWAKNVLDKNSEGCTTDNKKQKIMDHITSTPAYRRLVGDDSIKDEVNAWMEDRFFSE